MMLIQLVLFVIYKAFIQSGLIQIWLFINTYGSFLHIENATLFHIQNFKNFINKISQLDHRIKLVHNKNNLGAGLSRNKGLELSNGEYIAFWQT